MSELSNPTLTPVTLTSSPVNGWVVVQAANLQKADGYVLLDVIVSHPTISSAGPSLTDPKKIGEKTWHFSLVNIDGHNDSLTTSRIGEAISEFAGLVTGLKPREVHFHEHVCDKLTLCSTYTPE